MALYVLFQQVAIDTSSMVALLGSMLAIAGAAIYALYKENRALHKAQLEDMKTLVTLVTENNILVSKTDRTLEKAVRVIERLEATK